MSLTNADDTKEHHEALQRNLRAAGPLLALVADAILEDLNLWPSTVHVLRSVITFENVHEETTFAVLNGLVYPSEDVKAAILQSICYMAHGRAA